MESIHYSFWKRNGLSIVLLGLFAAFLFGQFLSGWKEYNSELQDAGYSTLSRMQYAKSGHFIQATFENRESEFLQMGLYVLLSIYLYQMGSAESRKLDSKVEEEELYAIKSHPHAPWPVKRGGLRLHIYSSSLSLAFLALFIMSFLVHFYGSLRNYNSEQAMDHLPLETAGSYIANANFWFESFQNWQSEFLAIFCIVLFSIRLRQKGSPQSKPVNAAYNTTGK